MNYKRLHDLIISNACLRKLPPCTYKEKHHVLPKCMGGKDDKKNLVLLTAREHFLVHILLTKIHPNNKKLLSAVMRMTKPLGFESSRLYESAKIRWAAEVARTNSGKNNMWFGTNGPMGGKRHKASTIKLMKESRPKGKDHPFYGAKGNAHPAYGKNNTPEAVAKRSGENAFWFGKISATRGTFWITNGKDDKRFKGVSIPQGWRKGRTNWKGSSK